jgi:hypothetical protein
MGPFVEEIRTQEWLTPIHTHQLRFPIPNPFARGEQFSSALMGIGFVLIGVAIYIFFFAESVTFYTPYSVESGGWTLHLPNGIDYSINSYVGISTMIGEVDPIIRTTGGPALDSGRRSFSTPGAIDFPGCLIT